jgi:hypothetical protein
MARREGGSKSNDVDEAMRKWHERGVGTRLYDAFTVAGPASASTPSSPAEPSSPSPSLLASRYVWINHTSPYSFIKKEYLPMLRCRVTEIVAYI